MTEHPITHPYPGACLAVLAYCLLYTGNAQGAEVRDIRDIEPDLTVPPLEESAPAPGQRVKAVLREYADSQMYHVLYLPTDWTPHGRYPIIVEYAGNGPFQNNFGDTSTGRPEGSKLGYGISGGEGFIWVCLPYINSQRRIQTSWWGNVELTLDYCRKAIRGICEDYGGDHSTVFLAGFSRGAIGCGYLGLHDDATADIWLGFIAYSHYDGVNESWGYPNVDRASAHRRLQRIGGRASFICSEPSNPNTNVAATQRYVEASGVSAPFTYRELGFRNHNDAWTLRPSADREILRQWVQQTLRDHPGTYAIRGQVTTKEGRPLANVRIESGFNHFTFTDAEGQYALHGLINGRRELKVSLDRYHFAPDNKNVDLMDQDRADVDFTGQRLPTIEIRRLDRNMVIEFHGTLQTAEDPFGPWTELAAIKSPWVIELVNRQEQQFLRSWLP